MKQQRRNRKEKSSSKGTISTRIIGIRDKNKYTKKGYRKATQDERQEWQKTEGKSWNKRSDIKRKGGN